MQANAKLRWGDDEKSILFFFLSHLMQNILKYTICELGVVLGFLSNFRRPLKRFIFNLLLFFRVPDLRNGTFGGKEPS